MGGFWLSGEALTSVGSLTATLVGGLFGTGLDGSVSGASECVLSRSLSGISFFLSVFGGMILFWDRTRVLFGRIFLCLWSKRGYRFLSVFEMLIPFCFSDVLC